MTEVYKRRTPAATVETAADAHSRLGGRARLDLAESGILDVRARIDSDIPFITNSWLKSYREEMRFVGNDVYYANHHALIERLWEAPECVWLVACWPKDPRFIMGWLCAEASDKGPIIHYAYVRHSAAEAENLRRLGIATRMVETFTEGQTFDRVWYTHSTVAARAALRGRMAVQPGAPGWEYNPYLAYRHVR